MPSPRDGVLAVVGDLVEDILVWLDEPIRPATDTASRVFRARGGSGANVAALAAPLRPTRFIGRVGADAAGDVLAAELAARGVDARLQRRGSTGTVVLIVDPSGERTMFPDRGASAMLHDVDPAWLDGVAHLHAPAYGLEGEPMRAELIALARRVHADGGTVSADASSTGLISALGPGRMLELLAELDVDFVFANAEEAELLGIAETGLPGATVLVKDGPLPTRVVRHGRTLARVPVAPVPVVRDRTGAGDAFAAGFLSATLDGAELADACLAGHAAAATVLASPGAHPEEHSEDAS